MRGAGQFIEELGLVGFDDHEIIGFFVFHDVSRAAFLRLDRVRADEGAAQVQFLEEILEGGDFIGFSRDLDLAAKEFGMGVQGTEELDRLAVDFGGGASAFAIDGQGGNVQVLQMGAHPIGDQGIQLRRVQALKDAADSRFTGSDELAGLAVPAGAQAAELVLVKGLRKLANIDQRVITRDHGRDCNGHDGSDAAMAPAFVAAGIAQCLQRLEQALGLLSTQRIVVCLRFPAIGRPSRRHHGSRKDLARFGCQRIKKDRLGLLVELIEIEPRTPETFAHADFNPIGRAITGAFEALRINIGFDQRDGVTVVFQPIGTESLQV